MVIIKNFKRFVELFNKKEKRNTLILLVMITIGGFAEAFGIGVIFPFTAVLLDQGSVEKYSVLKSLSEVSWIGGYRRFVVLMSIMLVLVFILKNLYMFFLIYVQNRFILNRQVEMSKKLFQSYIYKPYEYFFKKNTAELQRNINELVKSVTQGVFMTGLSLLTEIITIICILILLLIIDPISSVVIILVLGGFVVLLYTLLKGKLDKSAKKNNTFGIRMVKLVNEGLGGIKDIKVLGREGSFLSDFGLSGKIYAKQIAFFNLCNQSPRLLIETIAVSGLVIIIVINALRNPDMNASLPTIALFGMAAIKIIPSMNKITSNLTTIRFNSVLFNQIYEDLREAVQTKQQDKVERSAKRLKFEDKVEIKGMTYRYPETEKIVLDSLDLSVNKGETIGIVGSSGAGKTTFVDVLLGLLLPENGEIVVDGVNINEDIEGWRKNIGYVPQSIFLVDDTVAANVAFGVRKDEIDTDRVWQALETANLKEFIESLEEKLNTNVGERGVRLSGGQKQRIGIARALYDNPDILVLDEATSSLDVESEKIISDAIAAIGNTKTMIIIAHRLNTLEKCDTIYKVEDGKIMKTALYI